MRGIKGLFAAAAVTLLVAPGTASAADVRVMTPPPGCTGGHDGSKHAWASCEPYITQEYRVTAYNCSPVCGNAYGEWAAGGRDSNLTISWPAKILDIGVDFRPPSA